MSVKKSIGWTDKTINPIKGICKGGCWYCWSTSFYKRKLLKPKILLDCSVFDKLSMPPKKIFLCSTHDLFGNWISKDWRDIIFSYMESWPQHIFQILTKFPENIDRPMPHNVWLGVTIDGRDPIGEIEKSYALRDAEAKIKFYSFEPLIKLPCLHGLYVFEWVIVGKLMGFGKEWDPNRSRIEEIVNEYREFGVPIFMKDNLKDIWGEKLIQEWPE